MALDGVAYEGKDGSVLFQSTSIDSIGRGTAESWSGADFAITASVEQGSSYVTKSILGQAKLGDYGSLDAREKGRLDEQIRQMKRLTRSPKVLMIEEDDGGARAPVILSGNNILDGELGRPTKLEDYFVQRVLPTFDGDTRPEFVEAVQDSTLAHLRIRSRTLAFHR